MYSKCKNELSSQDRRLLGLATERCGLTPSGHKFTAYCATAVSAPDAAALHTEFDSWTPATHLGTDRVCRLQSDGVIAGGVPVGSMDFTIAALSTKLEQQGLAHSELRHLMAAHSMCCYLILRYCLAARWVCWLAGCVLYPQPTMTAVPAQIHDRRMQDSLTALLDLPAATLPPLVIRQAQLPARDGGLALPSMVLLAATAYIHTSLPRVQPCGTPPSITAPSSPRRSSPSPPAPPPSSSASAPSTISGASSLQMATPSLH